MSGGLKGESLQTLIMGEFSTPIALNIKGDKASKDTTKFLGYQAHVTYRKRDQFDSFFELISL